MRTIARFLFSITVLFSLASVQAQAQDSTFCQYNPTDSRCIRPGSSFCRMYPFDGRCQQQQPPQVRNPNNGGYPQGDNFCQYYPQDARCTGWGQGGYYDYCRRYPLTPSCRINYDPHDYCSAHPYEPSCRYDYGRGDDYCRRFPYDRACMSGH